MEKKLEQGTTDFQPKRGNPTNIVVENPLFQELPKHEVTLKSGRTLYRFTGSYDGERSLPHKVLRLMEQEKGKKDVD